MGFFESLLKGVVTVGATVVGISYHLVTEFKEKVKETVYKLQSVDSGYGPKTIDYSTQINETRSVNDLIIDIEAKLSKDGSLSSYDRQHLQELYETRQKIREVLEKKRELKLADNIANSQDSFDSISVDDANLQILQFHVGQNVLGKKCGTCNKPMILQWKRGLTVTSISQFFWGCSGFYSQTCSATQFIAQTEVDLITKIDRPEFQLSNQELNKIVELPIAKNNIRRRMSNIKNSETDGYLCPIHGEPMIVRENKKQNIGLMEQYFLGCPRHFSSGCKQIVTIKSAGQLASVLEKFYGNGVL